MKIAVQGCCHGELDAIYCHIHNLETRHKYTVDLLLICGDFQAVRNQSDLLCMAVPQKYRQLGDFYRYYTGEKTAPVLTIVIGGNHEASNYFWELYHGGWLAPNIYFLGHAGCVQVNGLRIAGASGIYKSHDFRLGHHERIPYDHGSMRSIYHIREYNVRRLSLLSSPDIFLSHDWPCAIEQHGDLRGLLRRKPFFRGDIESGRLGSPPLMGLLMTLKPEWWFAAHLHVKFEGIFRHESGTGPGEATQKEANPDEIEIDFDGDEDPSTKVAQDAAPNPSELAVHSGTDLSDVTPISQASIPAQQISRSETRFLALDKCLPRRDFLEVIDIPAPLDSPSHPSEIFSNPLSSSLHTENPPPKLTYDPEWLAITRAFDEYFSRSQHQASFPDEETARSRVSQELEWVQKNLVQKHTGTGEGAGEVSGTARGLAISEHQVFVRTAPGPDSEGQKRGGRQPTPYTNPQTVAFCKMLGIEDRISPPHPA
ncbi:lariat debranching enzyme, C-terminal domain-containing protein [Pisolithus croceorrhizus]|nr:lariat debranching enzyme, C-terminal domain-containing protein [Pisolithus croceorrhizus]